MSGSEIALFMVGGGLFLGAISSFYGQRFPFGDLFAPQHFPAPAPSHSNFSRALSMAGGVAGLTCILYALSGLSRVIWS